MDLVNGVLRMRQIAGERRILPPKTADSRDVASARVLAKLGMRREAHFVHDEIFKGEWSDQLVYALLGDEWRPRH